jgi:2-polyprenyl-6-methoxyphenol hydroxylase-like FAD-dependent oxidoreductase
LNTKGDAEIPVGDGTRFKLPFDTSTLFAIRSVNKKATTAISLGILPSRKTPSRVYNVIRDPKHEIWKINDGNVLREWFSKSFPRLDFTSKSSIIDQSEFDRFVSVESLSLPPCQYSPGLFVSSPNKKSAVIIMGDAAHTFPPDIGEGVNSGLDDVFALDEALGSNENIGAVAASYATRQGPEVRLFITSS